jgi:hypothetical protein
VSLGQKKARELSENKTRNDPQVTVIARLKNCRRLTPDSAVLTSTTR